jgi:hypothetical protein
MASVQFFVISPQIGDSFLKCWLWKAVTITWHYIILVSCINTVHRKYISAQKATQAIAPIIQPLAFI